MRKMPKAAKLFAIFKKELEAWHRLEKKIKNMEQAVVLLNREKKAPESLVGGLFALNCYLWHEEDKARSPVISDRAIAAVKRNIDKTNQARNNKIEEIDRFLLGLLESGGVKQGKRATTNSETPGAIIDRLSILGLKLWHTAEEFLRKDASVEHLMKCAKRFEVMTAQKQDLSGCYEILVKDLFAGRKRLKMYYQFKMYNDPSTNKWMRAKK
ncbi:MAG: DUF4254 domain-containing protein [Candidatus Firestonebacteria bacterium]